MDDAGTVPYYAWAGFKARLERRKAVFGILWGFAPGLRVYFRASQSVEDM